MTNHITEIAQRKIARIAGFFYLLQIPLGVFGILYVPKALLVSGDAIATASNILANEFLFRLSIVSSILCALVTIVTALFLYKLFKPVNSNYAALMVIFTLISAPVAMLNELNHVVVLLLLERSEYLTAFTPTIFFELHEYGVHIVDIFFGLWLLPMGYLVFRSGFIPKIIGVFLIIAGFGYLIDFAIFFLFPDIKVVISQYTFIGEVMMVLWLLWKGAKVQQQDNPAPSNKGT